MHGLTLLQDLAVIMIVAGLVTVVFHRLNQPVVLGYIIAGVIIGPHTAPFPLIHDEGTIRVLSELGVILLLFSLGLEFNLRKLRQVGGAALIAAILEVPLMVWIGYELGGLFGWRTMDRIFLGAMLSISSTTIIIKTLAHLGKTKEKFAQVIFGILIVEDIVAILMIALLSGIAMTGTLTATELGGTVGRLMIFLIAALVVGLLAVPRLLAYVGRFKNDEVLLVTVLGLCFGFALLALRLGYSVALGAFIIGAVVAEAREIGRIETLVTPVRDVFSAIFFVTIGLLFDPKMLAKYWVPVAIITVAFVAGKIIACSFGSFVGGNDQRTSLRVGTGLAQIGEFSFIIASLGMTLKVTSDFLYPIAVAVSVVTTLMTPYLIKSADGLVGFFERVSPQRLLRSMEVYTRWMGQLGAQRHQTLAAKLIRRWLWQIGLNVVMIGAVFIIAAFIGQQRPEWLRRLAIDDRWLQAALWLAAALVALPIFVALLRKLQALGLLLAETRVGTAGTAERTAAARNIVSQGVPLAGIVALALYVLLLSSALLPPDEILFVLAGVVVLLMWRFWRTLIRLYSIAQVALEETLAQSPEPRACEPARPMPLMLRDANLEVVAISDGVVAARKLIRELELRSRTGASIVAIQRDGANIINPSAEDELLPGDQVLLLGTRAQIEAAKLVMTEKG
ncbi:MAG: cation:proton antiporter [Verrucomicrobia subdivision 3 bacterium]|nr:cation:proton antiporter [Limisphaerales bacterium]